VAAAWLKAEKPLLAVSALRRENMHRDIRRARLASHSILAIHAASAIIFLSMGALHDQAQAQTARERRLNRTIEERQKALLELEGKRERASKPREERLLYQQLQQDFEQLQVINNNLSLAVSSSRTLDYEQIEKDIEEIRKRALRLKANLSLPEPGKTERPKKNEEELTPEALRSMLKDLDSLIKSFVENPVFQHLKVMNVGYSMRATRDLEDIIKLSEQIDKRAEVLRKASRDNP
jgi:hypothetical protein